MSGNGRAISLVEALGSLHAERTDEIVVTSMAVAREWMRFEPHPLDFNYVPSSMGQASALGLGLALGRPDRRVVVCHGDGALLMNLGSLVTITAQAPKNLILLIFDNGVYEVTGAQATPGTAVARQDGTALDYSRLAQACGFGKVYPFDDLATWNRQLRDLLTQEGPTCAVLKVAPVADPVGPRSPGPAAERAAEFAQALNASPGERQKTRED